MSPRQGTQKREDCGRMQEAYQKKGAAQTGKTREGVQGGGGLDAEEQGGERTTSKKNCVSMGKHEAGGMDTGTDETLYQPSHR